MSMDKSMRGAPDAGVKSRKARRAPEKMRARQVAEIGWREMVGLPELGLAEIKAKTDTGARTAALHAVDIRTFERDGAEWVRFRHPAPGHARGGLVCEGPVADRRPVKNTSGVPEVRYVIETLLVLGRRSWHIEVSLTNREEMGFDLILGRTSIRRHGLLVNPGRSFLAGPPQRKRGEADPA